MCDLRDVYSRRGDDGLGPVHTKNQEAGAESSSGTKTLWASRPRTSFIPDPQTEYGRGVASVALAQAFQWKSPRTRVPPADG